jgi:hypothetical protein
MGFLPILCVAKVSNISGYTKRIMKKIHKKEEALHRWCEAPLVFKGNVSLWFGIDST